MVAAQYSQNLVVCRHYEVVNIPINWIKSKTVHSLQIVLKHQLVPEYIVAVDVFEHRQVLQHSRTLPHNVTADIY